MAEESEMVGQLRSLIISMEGWRGQEEREEVECLSSGHFFAFLPGRPGGGGLEEAVGGGSGTCQAGQEG